MRKYYSTILIVDDNPDDRLFTERAFRKIGVENLIHSVSSGLEAIAYMAGEGKFSDRKVYDYPSFITTDLKMLGLDGFGVLEHLKQNPEWAGIPAVVLTSSGNSDDVQKAYMLGASSYHLKPGSPSELCRQLKVLHDYWMTCEVPQMDGFGRQLRTPGVGKLGERFPRASA